MEDDELKGGEELEAEDELEHDPILGGIKKPKDEDESLDELADEELLDEDSFDDVDEW